MLPNAKKDLHTLKTDFDENGVNRITPKLLRDLLVSVYSSRNPRKVMDSQDLGENDDLILVEMGENGNYIRLPSRFEVDTSGTPFVNQHYTICNAGVYPFSVITQSNDEFHTHEQSVRIGVGEIVEVVATPDYWFHWSGGSTVPSGGMIGFPVRIQSEVDDTEVIVCDSIPVEDARAIKWTISAQGVSDTRTSEILVNVKPTQIDACESFILGDDIDLEFSVNLVSGSINLTVNNQSGETLNIIVLRVIHA